MDEDDGDGGGDGDAAGDRPPMLETTARWRESHLLGPLRQRCCQQLSACCRLFDCHPRWQPGQQSWGMISTSSGSLGLRTMRSCFPAVRQIFTGEEERKNP